MVRLTSRERSCSRSQTDRIASRQPAAQRAPGARGRRGHLPPRLQDGPRGDRLEAARLALPLRPIAGLAQDEEPGRAGGEAGGGGGLVKGAPEMSVAPPGGQDRIMIY